MYPGDLHGEMQWMVECGFQPRDAIAAATVGPALWLEADSLGAIVPGAVADLVVLDADPLADIRNTRRIRLVIRRGRVLQPADLVRQAQADGATRR